MSVHESEPSARSRGRLIAWCSLVGVLAALGYASRFAGGKPPRNALFRYDVALNELLLFAIVLGVVLLIARGLPKRETFALRPPSSWLRALALGLGVFVSVIVASYVFAPLHGAREQGLTPSGWEPAHAGAFAVNALAFGLLGPIVEELTFRGLGFRLLQRYGERAAIVLVGVAFGLWHGLVQALPVLTVFGIGLAYLRSRTRSLLPTIALHVVFNGVGLALPFL